MRIVIAGGHGNIAMRLERLLAAKGHDVVGLIRKPEQADDIRLAGAEPAVLDLESASVNEVAGALEGADAAVFAAGAGPGSGAARKQTMDFAGAVLFADGAERAGAGRYVMLSSVGSDPQRAGDGVEDAYLRAKGAADADLKARSGFEWTILRPGGLTNQSGSGLVELSESPRLGRVPREDVAAVLAELVETEGTAGKTLCLVTGTTPVAEAAVAAAGERG